ncbi:hypothetical protein [Granulicella sp. dw_53]|uniref:hypothetical protein n=1 Tax=Granulicella sp. dw_53 TaxID=2719792 RepID=UPI001BD32DA9|nr:hypothetical protein [Granulicella sp. dw_53]
MSWHDRLYLTLGIFLAIFPLVANVFFLEKRKTYLLVEGRRYRVALAGLILALIASIPSPLFFIALELPWGLKGEWLPLVAAFCMPLGLVSGVIAIGMLAFASGKLRWIGIATSLISVVLLYVILLGLSN